MKVDTQHSPIPKVRRRRFRFSIRTLLCSVVIVSFWLAFQSSSLHKQTVAVATVERLGGYVDYDFRHRFDDSHAYDSDAAPPGPAWLRKLLGQYYAANVVEVQLYTGDGRNGAMSPAQFGDTEAECLSGLTDLRWLVLIDTRVTDRGLKYFTGMKKLERLDLEGTLATADGVRELHKYLPGTKIIFCDGELLPSE